jgi:hypothetical protein
MKPKGGAPAAERLPFSISAAVRCLQILTTKEQFMASQAQFTANRTNAKQSTGPKTEAGKQKSSENAVKHGFYSKSFLIREDEREDFEHLRNNLGITYRPEDGLACDLFHQLLHAAWNLHRLRRMESEIYLKCDSPFRDPATLAELDAIRRHKGHFERVHHRVQKSLKDHMSTFWNSSAFPEHIQKQVPPVIDTQAFQRAHNNKWKLYTEADYLDETIKQKHERKQQGLPPTPPPKQRYSKRVF